MDIKKANEIAELVIQKTRLEKQLKTLSSGYANEWEIKNSHNGNSVGLTDEQILFIRSELRAECNRVVKRIEEVE